MEEDTNIKKIKKNNGAKKFFDIDFYLDLKEKFMDLEPAKKAIVLFMSLFAVFLLFFISSKLTNDSGKGFFSKSYSDNSEQVYQLGPNVMNKVLGYYKTRAQEDFEHPKKFRLKFRQSKQEKSSIYYSITKTEYLDEVIIKLNGVKIASAPLTSDAIQKVKLALPFENLSFDEDNVLEFINTRNLTSKKFKRWGLLIHKFEKKILPKPDFDKARENYIKADKFYNQRRISRGNRFKAMKYYQVSIDFMELMPANEKPDFYDDSIDKIKEINKSFDEMYSRNKFAIFKAIKFGDIKKAKLHINNIINEIPDEDDPRYNEALELLNRL